MGLWWPLGYHLLTGCQSLSATLPAPHHLQRPAGNRQNSHCQLPLPPFLILSDEGAGGPHEEAAEVQRGTGTPPQQPGTASHPESPHSRLHGWSPWPQAAIRLSLFNSQTLLQLRLGFLEPIRVCHTSRPWDNLLLLSESPLPLSLWLLPHLPLQDSPSLCQTWWITPHRCYPPVSGPGLSCEPVKADISLPRPSALFLHVHPVLDTHP